MDNYLRIKGAREHNLKNIDLELPKNKLITITGISGSGKSTLAFDTIYAEGQRRYVESLSAYARQFLGLMNKPDVDSIEGLSPAISIEQKTTSKNPRSTVGTITEIYDYLRLLYARIGTQHCPICSQAVQPQTAEQIANTIISSHNKRKCIVYAPVIRQKKGTYEQTYKDYQQKGYTRAYTDGKIHDIDQIPKLERYVKHDIFIQIDRLIIADDKETKTRLNEAIENAMKEAGRIVVVDVDEKIYTYSGNNGCINHPELSFEDLEPRMFSFNSPFGACPDCHGLGLIETFDADLIIPDHTKSIAEGAFKVFRNHVDGWRIQQLKQVCKTIGVSFMDPWGELLDKQKEVLLYGLNKEIHYKYKSKNGGSSMSYYGDFEGVIPMLERLYKQTESEHRREQMRAFMTAKTCQTCKGKRLSPQPLAVLIEKRNIIDITELSIADAQTWFKDITLSEQHKQIAKGVLKEINDRLNFLVDVGVGYLSLSRSAATLSGGEAQRIRLATQIGSNLTGVLYVLDEPSIGLHQRDNEKLISTLKRLRDLGNTVLVVEHDEDTMLASDYLVDIGPGAGAHGGRIVAVGTPQEVSKNKASLTGQYLAGKKHIAIPQQRREAKSHITLVGCRQHNLKDIDVAFPTGVLCVISGVSGSGKSTLVNDTLYPAINNSISRNKTKIDTLKSIKGAQDVDKIIVIDQSPIGRTPRSNPATYINLFADIRDLFSATPQAKARGYEPGRFSFNVEGGRCEACQGDGLIKIEMNFLPDIYVTCEDCKGKRYNTETLQVTYKDKNISDVLEMSVEEALAFFEKIPAIRRKLETLNDVGLGYIKLGQSATTLSGGEAQRIKLTAELAKRSTGKTVYILDEPTTGLHFDDVAKLLEVIHRLVDKGNSVFIIEHNLDVIKSADWIIDLGPEGGAQGGNIIAQGTPEDIIKEKKSFTAQFLRKVLEQK